VFDLKDKRILVFGGSSGIGLSVAELSHRLGGTVTLASRSPEKLEKAAGSIGPDVAFASVDVTKPDTVSALFESLGTFDHVVVTAAQLETGPLRTSSMESAREAMESKFWGACNVARLARIAPDGTLTFVSGILDRRPAPQATLLGAINSALNTLGQGLALELAPVRVNVVSPGRLDTPWWDILPDDTRQKLLDDTSARLPVRRIGTADDIAIQIVVFFLNGFMTGSVVAIDGGGAIA
jgi:NAD(P)-dependent dehydrogenase (short-subunit alcohol dehydrogenase family)